VIRVERQSAYYLEFWKQEIIVVNIAVSQQLDVFGGAIYEQLEASVGIGRLKRRFRTKCAMFGA
jgi:hypothetical protein